MFDLRRKPSQKTPFLTYLSFPHSFALGARKPNLRIRRKLFGHRARFDRVPDCLIGPCQTSRWRYKGRSLCYPYRPM
jgi:hypothetical protein